MPVCGSGDPQTGIPLLPRVGEQIESSVSHAIG
jgi:hypothetical protein